MLTTFLRWALPFGRHTPRVWLPPSNNAAGLVVHRPRQWNMPARAGPYGDSEKNGAADHARVAAEVSA